MVTVDTAPGSPCEESSGGLHGAGSFWERLKNVEWNGKRSQRSLGEWLRRPWQPHLLSLGNAGLAVIQDSKMM